MNSPFPPRSRLDLAYVLIGVMCIFSGAWAMRRLDKADPAEIF